MIVGVNTRRLVFGMLAATTLLASGCCQPWMCQQRCGLGHRAWFKGLVSIVVHRPRLIPDAEINPPRAKFHPVPSDNVFAPRPDTLPTVPASSDVPRRVPHLPGREPQLRPPQPPPESLPDPAIENPVPTQSREAR